MKDIQQLIKKDSQEGRYADIYPKTFLDAVKDKATGKNLTEILAGFNMYFLPYLGNREQTRLQVPMFIRKQGLWITYVLLDKTVYTEWYAHDRIDDANFQLSSNWRQGNNMLVGDITISSNGTWVVNGIDTEVKAQGEQGVTPLLQVDGNKLQVSYNQGINWTDISDYIASWFRWVDSGVGVGKIQISRDNKTWSDLSPEFANNLKIQKYVTALPSPTGIPQGSIYMVGPTYDPNDTGHTNPIYRMQVLSDGAWVDNGKYTSISAGVVQELGNSETEVISQKFITSEVNQINRRVNSYKGNVFIKDTYRSGKIIEIPSGNIVSSVVGETSGTTDFILIPEWATVLYVYSHEGDKMPTSLIARFSNDPLDITENTYLSISQSETIGKVIPLGYKYVILTIVRDSNTLFTPNLNNIYVGFSSNYKTYEIAKDIIPKPDTDINFRFQSLDFNCFEMYKIDRGDKEIKGTKISNIYRSFIQLRLTGFDSTKLYKLSYFKRTMDGYALIFGAYNGVLWERYAYFDAPLYSEINPNGINIFESTLSDGKSVKAIIDYSFIPSTYSEFIDQTENSDPNFIVKQECFDPDFITQAQSKDFVGINDLEYKIGNNLANPAYIEIDKLIGSTGTISKSVGWNLIGIPVNQGDIITFGNFTLNRDGYCAFYNNLELVYFQGEFNVSINPKTVITPEGANIFYIDIKSPLSTDDDYSKLTVSKGPLLLPYEPFDILIRKIKGYSIEADTAQVDRDIQAVADNVLQLDTRIDQLQDSLEHQFQNSNYRQMDLPYSDGSNIKEGYAYIDTLTQNLKIK